jgi:hypothetical protein
MPAYPRASGEKRVRQGERSKPRVDPGLTCASSYAPDTHSPTHPLTRNFPCVCHPASP